VLFLVKDDVIVVVAGGSPGCVEGSAGIGVDAANMLVAPERGRNHVCLGRLVSGMSVICPEATA
jgi:hypothetical protein